MRSGEMLSADWMLVSELATTWMSRMAMNMPTHMAAKPIQDLAGVVIPQARR